MKEAEHYGVSPQTIDPTINIICLTEQVWQTAANYGLKSKVAIT